MHLSAISLFELGQFLRIFLWIFLPIFILSILITSYIHYRKRRKKKEQENAVARLPFDRDDHAVPDRFYSNADARPEDGNSAYRGLLWLKDKYERERERSTAKYMQLKEEHKQLKEKFEELEDRYRKERGEPAHQPVTASGHVVVVEPAGSDHKDPGSDNKDLGSDHKDLESIRQSLDSAEKENSALREELVERSSLKDQLAEKNLQVAFLQNQLDQRINNYHHLEHQGREAKERLAEWEARHPQIQELLDERQATIDRLREQLQQETQKTAEVKAKLESGGNLFLKIHQELDQLLTKDAENLAIAETREINGDSRNGDPRGSAVKAMEGAVPAPPADHHETEASRITAWVESEGSAPALNQFAW